MGTFTITQQPSENIIYLYPNSDVSTQFTPVGDTLNHDCVDDAFDIADESTYVWWNGISTGTDIYDLDTTNIATGTINNMTLYSRAKSNLFDQHTSGLYGIILDNGGGTRKYSGDFGLTTGYNLFSKSWELNPFTTVAWTWNNINNIRIGVECSSPSLSSTKNWTKYPNAYGTYTEIVAQYPSSGTHYDKVNDYTSGDESRYVIAYSTGTGGQKDTYNIENHTTESGTINSVTVYIRCRNRSSYTDMYCKPLVLSWTTLSEPEQFNITSSWNTFSHTWTSRPSDSTSWTWSDIDNMQIGVRIINTHTSSYEADCTLVYVVVNYTEYTNPQIHTTQCYATVNYIPSPETTTLNKPSTYTISNSRKINEINFWNKTRKVYGYQRENKTLSMNGCEWNTTTSQASVRLETVSNMQDNGDSITISGFTDPNINTTWVIKSFGYNRNAEHPFLWDWNMVCEKA